MTIEGRAPVGSRGEIGRLRRRKRTISNWAVAVSKDLSSLPSRGWKRGLCYVAPEDTNDTSDEKGPRFVGGLIETVPCLEFTKDSLNENTKKKAEWSHVKER